MPGVGEKTEKEFWGCGINCWEDALSSAAHSHFHDDLLSSISALEKGDTDFFLQNLPTRELWRLYDQFEPKTAFLDIETTGFSKYYDDLTLIGLYDGTDYKSFVLGDNLEDFVSEINKYPLLVTFNGSLFDVPFIRTKLPAAAITAAHIDLRFVLKRLGYSGGLKNIEREIGITRNKEVSTVSGYEAVILWHKYQRGDLSALERLIKYNYEDTVNLKKLMNLAYCRLSLETFNKKENKKVIAPKAKTSGRGEIEVAGKKIEVKKPKEVEKVRLSDITKDIKGKLPKVVGIDLTGSEKRATGWALMDGEKITTKLLVTDKELIEETIKEKPDIISIDSPLSYPKGRKSPYDNSPCRKHGISRECERQLKQAGISVFWCLLPSMQKLTIRGMKLAKEFRKRGFTVIESFPGAAQDILGIPRKKTSLDDLKQGLVDFGLTGDFVNTKISHDELDAITSALVGYFYCSGHYEALGNEDEDYLIIPSLHKLTGKKKLVDFLAK